MRDERMEPTMRQFKKDSRVALSVRDLIDCCEKFNVTTTQKGLPRPLRNTWKVDLALWFYRRSRL